MYEDMDDFNKEDEDTDEWTPQSNTVRTPKRKSQIAKKKTSSSAEVSKVVTSLLEDCTVTLLHPSSCTPGLNK